MEKPARPNLLSRPEEVKKTFKIDSKAKTGAPKDERIEKPGLMVKKTQPTEIDGDINMRVDTSLDQSNLSAGQKTKVTGMFQKTGGQFRMDVNPLSHIPSITMRDHYHGSPFFQVLNEGMLQVARHR